MLHFQRLPASQEQQKILSPSLLLPAARRRLLSTEISTFFQNSNISSVESFPKAPPKAALGAGRKKKVSKTENLLIFSFAVFGNLSTFATVLRHGAECLAESIKKTREKHKSS